MSRESCPMPALDALKGGFLENRARVLEVAAFLDRLDRCREPDKACADFRYQALLKGLELLLKSEGNRAEALLRAWSDPTDAPLESAKGLKSAHGAWNGEAP